MKEFILDTDIGADSDDAVCLALAASLHKKGEACLKAVTLSTGRKGAASCVRAVLDAYGVNDIPIGRMSGSLACDSFDKYAGYIQSRYGFSDEAENAREIIKVSDCPIVAIGPLTNLACALKQSEGKFYEATAPIYVMSCRFDIAEPEWNVEQDIIACREVFSNYKGQLFISPYELGAKYLTGKSAKSGPLRDCLDTYAGFEKAVRESWDPITLLSFVKPELFEFLSGNVEVSNEGISTFKRGEGSHFIIKEKADGISEIIDDYIRLR